MLPRQTTNNLREWALALIAAAAFLLGYLGFMRSLALEKQLHQREVRGLLSQALDALGGVEGAVSFDAMSVGRASLELARRNADEALLISPNNSDALRILGCSLYFLGSKEDGLSRVRLALKEAPSDPKNLNAMGLLLVVEGSATEGLDLLGEASRLKPDWAPPWINISAYRLRNGQYAEAVAAAEEAVRLDPASWIANSALAAALVPVGRTEAAQLAAETAWELAPPGPKPMIEGVFGDIAVFGGDRDLALSHYQACLAGSPSHLNCLVNAADILLGQGQPERALEFARRAAASHPEIAMARLNHAEALIATGSEEEARREFTAASELDPTLAKTLFVQAEGLVKRNELAVAERYLRTVLALNSESKDALDLLESVLEKQSRLQQ